MAKYTEGRFVSVVGLVDLDQGRGDINYVSPTTRAILRDQPGDGRIELEIQDAEGRVLHSEAAVLRRSSCAPPGVQNGMIQENLPFQEGMKRIVLKLDGAVADTYEAGEPPSAAELTLGGPGPGQPANRRALRSETPPAEARGITYTVQVQPNAQGPWQTIAVGRKTPEAEVDTSQFPGAEHLAVRVLQTDGFTSAEILRRDVEPDVTDPPASAPER